MKIAIIADVHDNLANLAKVLTFLKKEKIDFLIACGDIGNQETLDFLAQNFSGQIYLVFGNIEEEFISQPPDWPNMTISQSYGEIVLEDKKIAYCHFPEIAKKLAKEKNVPNLVFYGHTHQPKEEMFQGVKLINPGTVAGLFSRSTFALYDMITNNAQLKETNLV